MNSGNSKSSSSRQGITNEGVEVEDYLHPQGQDYIKMTQPKTSQPHTVPGLRYIKHKSKGSQSDSGVADLDSISPDLSPLPTANGKPRPPSTAKNYDYADYGGHQYEELPHPRVGGGRQTSPESCSEYQSSGGTATAETLSETGDTAAIVKNAEQRKRYNPLYDTMVDSSPNIYNKVKTSQDSGVQQRLKMMKIIIIILILISCLSLAISLYVIIVYSAGPLRILSLQKELDSLHNNYSELNQKMNVIENMVAGNSSLEYLKQLGQQVTELSSQTTSQIESLEQRLKDTKQLVQSNQQNIDRVYNNASLQLSTTQQQLVTFQSNFTSSLSLIQNEFEAKLEIISKMEGPPGVGNLSACYMKEFKVDSSTTRQETNTAWEPNAETLQKNVVMFAMCEVRNGVNRYLEIQSANLAPNMYQYRCLCSGSLSATPTIRSCLVHLWLCPRESFGGS